MIFREDSTPEGKAFWDGVDKAAAIARDWPYWKRVGISEDEGDPKPPIVGQPLRS